MVGGNILITLVCFENILITIGSFWEHHDHIQKTEQHLKQISNVPIGHVVETFSECHWGNFKCCINVPNLLLAGKWWVPSTRAYNVLKMFSLVSRPPRPQWDQLVPTITASRNSCHQDHLPLSVSITSSQFGRNILTVASPCDRSVSLLSIFPLSLYTQCPVLSVDPLSL